MDRELLSAVVGRRVWRCSLVPAVLRGYRRSSVRGASYPIVVPQRGASVEGVILRGVGAVEIARLRAYEGDGYELVRTLARKPPRTVLLFQPKPGFYDMTQRRWTLAGWRLRHKRSVMKAFAAASGPRMRR